MLALTWVAAAGCVPQPISPELMEAEQSRAFDEARHREEEAKARERAAAEALAIQSGRRAAVEFKGHLSRTGSVNFRNWDGKSHGTDGDMDLCFLRDGKVIMIVNSLVRLKYVGTYAIDFDGKIVMTASELGQPWPPVAVMVLRQGDRCLVLHPRAYQEAAEELAGFWSFRMIPAKEARWKELKD